MSLARAAVELAQRAEERDKERLVWEGRREEREVEAAARDQRAEKREVEAAGRHKTSLRFSGAGVLLASLAAIAACATAIYTCRLAAATWRMAANMTPWWYWLGR